MPLTLSHTTEERIRIHAHPLTPGGDPAPLDGPITYSVISGTHVIDSIDALSCWVRNPAAGTSAISAKADADLGAGFIPIEDSVTVTSTSPMATSLGLQADAPELLPPV